MAKRAINDAFVDTQRGDTPKQDYLDTLSTQAVEKAERETYQSWFRSLGLDGMKAPYDAQ
jgi:hypothetical protein